MVIISLRAASVPKLLPCLCLLIAGIVLAEEPATNRPADWAKPGTVDGVPNLHEVTPNLYRSAQPTAQGMQELDRLGIKTVVNLRSFHSDRDEIRDTKLENERMYMKAWHPERKEAHPVSPDRH